MLWYVVDVVSEVVGFGGTQCHVCGMRRHGVEGDGNRFEWRKDREKEEKGKKREREREEKDNPGGMEESGGRDQAEGEEVVVVVVRQRFR